MGITVAVAVVLSFIAALMQLCVYKLCDLGLHYTVEHKFSEFTEKFLAAVLHHGLAECHVVVTIG
ncbi:hypothetical protein ECC18A13_036160 [Enterobacter sp. 18A13]|nr:hypothetical protein ECC18A13_036160 [Enterobacter sp. 18A13]